MQNQLLFSVNKYFLTLSYNFSQVMEADCLHFISALGLLCAIQVIPVSQSTPPCSVTGQLCVFMKQDQKGVNVNKLCLFEEFLGIQSILSIAMQGSTVAFGSCMLLIWGKKGTYFRILFRSICFLSGKKPGVPPCLQLTGLPRTDKFLCFQTGH